MNSVTVYGQPKYLVLIDTDITTAADGLTPLQVDILPESKIKTNFIIIANNYQEYYLSEYSFLSDWVRCDLLGV